MLDVMGVINLGNEQDSLKELTYFRNQASVPFGGRYRLIDFTLSNMVNSGVRDIAILTMKKYRSLMDHLGTGKDWELDRKRGGLFILPPSYYYTDQEYLGDLQNFYEHLDFLLRGNQQYVIITGGSIVANIDYRPIFYFHQQNESDITLIYKEIENSALQTGLKKIGVDEEGRVVKITDENGSFSDRKKVYMDMMIMKKSLLLNLIESCAKNRKCNLLKDGIISNLDELKVYGYPYKGYMANINSINSYYQHSLQLISENAWKELFYQPRLIYTKIKNEPPAKYLENSSVRNSLIVNGSVIEGRVENSIIFRGVKVGKGAYIKNSIILQKSDIGENAIIENAILDKKVKVMANKEIRGTLENPYVVPKRLTI